MSALTFEQAFQRLEEILETLSEGTVALDTSLKLYEEANKLIVDCHSRLTHAEKRVETLIKERDGQLSLDANNQPSTEAFNDRLSAT